MAGPPEKKMDLDWIFKRNKPKQQSVANRQREMKPEGVKERFAKLTAEQDAKLKPADRLPADAQRKLESVRATRDATLWPNVPQGVPVPAGSPDPMPNAQPMRQNREGQGRNALALSPTDSHKGRPATEKASGKAPEKAAERPKTWPRPRASYER